LSPVDHALRLEVTADVLLHVQGHRRDAENADVHRFLVVRLQVIPRERRHGEVGLVEIAVGTGDGFQLIDKLFVQLDLSVFSPCVRLGVLALERGYDERGQHVVAVDDGVFAELLDKIAHNRQRRAREVEQGYRARLFERVHLACRDRAYVSTGWYNDKWLEVRSIKQLAYTLGAHEVGAVPALVVTLVAAQDFDVQIHGLHGDVECVSLHGAVGVIFNDHVQLRGDWGRNQKKQKKLQSHSWRIRKKIFFFVPQNRKMPPKRASPAEIVINVKIIAPSEGTVVSKCPHGFFAIVCEQCKAEQEAIDMFLI
jgi:hypothetical protein